jgi:hypothetical protein
MQLKAIVFTIALLLGTFFAMAQPYNNAIGAHIGSPGGVSFKHFTGDKFAIEGILGGYFGPTGGVSLVLLAENHAELFFPDLYVVYGLGAHAGSVNQSLFLGGDGILGLEYNFGSAPFNFMVDIKPRIGLQSGGFQFGMDGGLALRYILN